ncbi:MAG: hypothetical protein K9M80_03090 [Candidatus Marinimicrobia bacterium]|nr:hypothetical protein [Candidatus Neomarinimicrobiota bacterium]
MKDLYFDVRDVFRTSRMALSGKKIWVHLIGLLLGWFVYSILTYVALLVSGSTLVEIWQVHHLFPALCGIAGALPWYSWLIYAIGIIAWVLIFLYFSVAVARITYKQLKGDEFFSSGDSLKYAKKHGKSAILAPISVILIIAFFIVMAIIAAWISKWPVLDIIFFGLPYLLYFVVAVFVIYTALSLIVSLILGPAVVGSAEEDTMETVFQSYSTLWSQPWRLICYEAVVGATTAVATFVYGYFMIAGYRFFNYVFGRSWLMGDKIDSIVKTASSYILGSNSSLSEYFASCFRLNPEITSNIAASSGLGVTEVITTVLVVIAIFFIFASIVSYGLTNITVGQTLVYVVLRKKKDEENLLERKDEDELEEEEEFEPEEDFETEFEEDEELELEEEEESSEEGDEQEPEEEEDKE